MTTDYKLRLNSIIDPSETSGCFIYHQFSVKKILPSAHTVSVLMCFVCILEEAEVV
jgi:hypothetical protein